MQNTNRQPGFTLIEMAIVIAIIGIVLGGLFSGMSAMRESSKFKEDQLKLKDIKSALLSYVAVNGHLPCPDTDNNGLENRTNNYCTADQGTLPYNQLNTHAVNAYGFAFSYHVNRAADSANALNADFSASYFGICVGSNDPCFDKDTPPTATVSDGDNFTIENGSGQLLANQLPLVVISHGQNGCNNVSSFEASNCSTNATTYYQAPQNKGGANQFDDVLIWLSSLEIKNATPEILPSNSTNPGGGADGTDPDGFIPVTQPPSPTEVNFDQVVNGDFNDSSQITTTNQDDKIKIEGDMNRALDLNNGEDSLYVSGNLNAILDGGNQDKTIFIDGDVNQPINLGNGDNTIEVTGNVNALIYSDNGSNKAIFHNDVNQAVNLGTAGQLNEVYVGGNINATISARGSIYINQTPSTLPNYQYDYLSGFSIILCRQSIGSTTWVNCR